MALVIGEDTMIRRQADVIAAESDGEMVLLNRDRGDFVHINNTAGRIWAALETPRTIVALCRLMAEMFDTDEVTCRDDVIGFVAMMNEHGLIETA